MKRSHIAALSVLLPDLVGVAADEAVASYTARVQGDILEITGAGDTVLLRLRAGGPNVLDLIVP